MAEGRRILTSLGKWFLVATGKADICESCCGPLTHCNCNSGNVSDPRVKMTLSWDDTDTTKDMFGCTWSNGETKEMCPDSYTNGASIETWSMSSSGNFSPGSASGLPTPISAKLKMTAQTTIGTVTPTTSVTSFASIQRARLTATAGVAYSTPNSGTLFMQFRRVALPTPTNVVTTDAVDALITAEDLDMAVWKSVFSAMGKPSIQDCQFGQMTLLNPNSGYKYTIKWERLPSSQANPNILTTPVTPDYWKASAP